MSLSGTEVLIVLLVLAFGLIPLVALISVVLHPRSDFDALGQSKSTWIILLVLGLLIWLLGVIVGSYYLLTVRPKLDQGATP